MSIFIYKSLCREFKSEADQILKPTYVSVTFVFDVLVWTIHSYLCTF